MKNLLNCEKRCSKLAHLDNTHRLRNSKGEFQSQVWGELIGGTEHELGGLGSVDSSLAMRHEDGDEEEGKGRPCRQALKARKRE